ncbi:nucleotidyltransferase domain-containing protein [bacterium]|nr:nucleotidyltransferase domain-containing protein [bacterium]
MENQKEIKKIVRQIARKYKPEKIILFGSFAWGNPTQDSDVDLFIVKNTKKAKGERLAKVEEILSDRKIPLDILVYTPNEVKERLSLGYFFIEDIVKKGKLIYAGK